MVIKELKNKEDAISDAKLTQAQIRFGELIKELNNKNLPNQTVEVINKHIEELNSSLISGRQFKKLLVKKQSQIIRLLEKKHKIVPKNYYRSLWMVLGMSAIGLPIGAALGASIGNMAFLGIGLPIGMVIGLATGASMDKKALNEGRQLDVEIWN